jgi:hypothetical protein
VVASLENKLEDETFYCAYLDPFNHKWVTAFEEMETSDMLDITETAITSFITERENTAKVVQLENKAKQKAASTKKHPLIMTTIMVLWAPRRVNTLQVRNPLRVEIILTSVPPRTMSFIPITLMFGAIVLLIPRTMGRRSQQHGLLLKVTTSLLPRKKII